MKQAGPLQSFIFTSPGFLSTGRLQSLRRRRSRLLTSPSFAVNVSPAIAAQMAADFSDALLWHTAQASHLHDVIDPRRVLCAGVPLQLLVDLHPLREVLPLPGVARPEAIPNFSVEPCVSILRVLLWSPVNGLVCSDYSRVRTSPALLSIHGGVPVEFLHEQVPQHLRAERDEDHTIRPRANFSTNLILR